MVDGERPISTAIAPTAYAANPERFVRHPPRPPALPTAAWINKPKIEDALHTNSRHDRLFNLTGSARQIAGEAFSHADA